MCCGVLCEWGLSGVSSRTPLLAVDVLAAAYAALASPADSSTHNTHAAMAATDTQQQLNASSSLACADTDASCWVFSYAVSQDGSRVAVVAGQAHAGVLLLYDLPARGGSSDIAGSTRLAGPQLLLQGEVLAGGGCVSWHPKEAVLVVGCGSSSCSLTISLSAGASR
jgi:hypothetical protein